MLYWSWVLLLGAAGIVYKLRLFIIGEMKQYNTNNVPSPKTEQKSSRITRMSNQNRDFKEVQVNCFEVIRSSEFKKPGCNDKDNVDLKMIFLFYLWFLRYSTVIFLCYLVSKIIMKLNLVRAKHLKWKAKKTSRCGSLSLDNAEFGHFRLFCRGRQRNVPRNIMHMHSHCSAHLTFCLVTFLLLWWLQ